MQTRWVTVAVRFPTEVWKSGRDDFRVTACERGADFLPDSEQGADVWLRLRSEHAAQTVAEAAIRAIEAVQQDAAAAGIGIPTGLSVDVHDEPPRGARRRYHRRTPPTPPVSKSTAA